MNAIKKFHDKAMDLAEIALLARVREGSDAAMPLFEQALEYEVAAIESMDEYIEPTYSVLHRSAGTMAFHCNKLRKAEKLAATALAKDPPPEIAAELRELLEQVHSQMRRELEGVAMSAD